MEIEIGKKYWWSRLGREGPFETLVTVAEKSDQLGAVKVTFLVPQLKGQPPITVERTCNIRYLRQPFTAGDERMWDRLGSPDNKRSYCPVRVQGVEENSGLLLCTCEKCPHTFKDGGTLKAHRVLPRFVKNAADILNKPTPALTPVPAPTAPLSTTSPKPDYTRTVEVIKEVVLALARGETPQPEDIDFLTGNLGKGATYAVPAKS